MKQTLRMGAAATALVIFGCRGSSSSDEVSTEPPSGPAAAADAIACDAAAGVVPVSLQTEDGLTLEADYHPAGTQGGPAVMLLHMIPPGNDKSNYPLAFIEALRQAGYSVLNVNRRGAGKSGGVAKDAYEGPKGRLDVVAAHTFLTGQGCRAPAEGVFIVGASNGTTSALDFTVQAEADRRPPALVFLSPGAYTENQHKVAEQAAVLAPLPIFMGFPSEESEWPAGVRSVDTGAWEFHEYAGGQHGSKLLTTNPPSTIDIVRFFDRHRPG